MRTRKKNEPERNIEGRVTRWARDHGVRTRKMNGLGNRGWPDQLFVGLDAHAYIEFKKPGEEPTEQQDESLTFLRDHGHQATWFDNSEEAIVWLSSVFKKHLQRHQSRREAMDSKELSTKGSSVRSRARRGRSLS